METEKKKSLNANSIVSYFILLAGLGISDYAVREGAALRHDRVKLNRFADEMFTFNIISTVIAYFLLLIVILIAPGIGGYRLLLIILSLQVVLKLIGFIRFMRIIFILQYEV